MSMSQNIWGNEYRTTRVCIDSYDNGVPTGRMYNPGLPEGKSFESLTRFIIEMERMLDEMKFPQAHTATRSFAPAPEYRQGDPPPGETERGALATFAVRVLFRQNSSWQGSIAWMDQGREESFRSVLELILLMDSALCETPSA